MFYLIDTYNFSNSTVRVSIKVTLFLAKSHREEAITFSFWSANGSIEERSDRFQEEGREFK